MQWFKSAVISLVFKNFFKKKLNFTKNKTYLALQTAVIGTCVEVFFRNAIIVLSNASIESIDHNYANTYKSAAVRASALKNATLSYFTILKSYFINYTIPFYNTPYIQKLYYFNFSLKYYFFNLSLLFLSYHYFFSAKG